MSVVLFAALIGAVSAHEFPGCCWFTGGGHILTIDGKDSFGGNAMTMKNKPDRGEWEYVIHSTGQIFHGTVTDILYCEYVPTRPGPGHPEANANYIRFVGTGVLDHVSGYTFWVKAYDSGEPAFANEPGDHYWVRIYDPDGILVVEEDGDVIGNFQIHPSNNGHPCPTGMDDPYHP
ncbi:MAG TPA: hypothetical protein VE134_06870 [Methanomicrobiales archaeon]|nr:hypothetical protein [Methanomicrobiales archaeon]